MRQSDLLLDPPRSMSWLPRLGGMQLFVLSFLALIGVGTLGLLILPGLYTGAPLGFVDALFTATSAVCVTGLIVVDTATYFTTAGQAWILLLIQAGGLGILTFTTLILTALGRRHSLRMEEATGGYAMFLKRVEGHGLIFTVFTVTFAVEAVGALALWLLWRGEMGSLGAIWPAVFHAVSAFCNAGFSVFSDSLVGFRRSPLTLLVVGLLVVAGGLGFIVVEDLRTRFVHRLTDRLAVHSQLVLWATAFLLVGGTVMYLGFEWRHTLADLPVVDRVANAFFMSVTPRTAGFNTVDYGKVTNPSLILTIGMMLVGGSPGSTAGGLKTITLMLLILLLLARLQGQSEVLVFNRTIPRETLQRATGLAMGGLVVLATAVFILLVTESSVGGLADRDAFAELVFEAHSAFGTVGLSMGVTARLSSAGRVVLSVLMFFGRLGPAAVIAAMGFAVSPGRSAFRYAEEDVILG